MQQEDMEKLNEFIKSKPDSRELMRALAVKFALLGYDYQWISKTLMVSHGFISKWKKVFEEAGIDELKLAYKGRIPYLMEHEKEEVIGWIKQQDQLSLVQLKTHISAAYQIEYKSDKSYYDLLYAAGMSWKKSQKVNPKADPQQIAQKKWK